MMRQTTTSKKLPSPTLMHFIFLCILISGETFAFEYIHTFLQDNYFQRAAVDAYDLTVSVYYISSITAYLLLPIVSKYMAHNYLLFIGCALYISTFIAFPFFLGKHIIYVVMATMGISRSILSNLGLILLQANSAPNRQAQTMGLLHTFAALASFGAPFLIPIYKASHLDFFYFGGIIMALLSVFYFVFRKRFGVYRFPAFKDTFKDSWKPVSLFLKYPYFFIIVTIISFQSSIGEGYLTMWGEVSNLSRDVSEYLSGTYYLGAILFTLPLTYLQPKIAFHILMSILSLVMLVLLTGMIFVNDSTMYMVASAILGAMIVTQHSLTIALVSRLFGEHLSFAITFFLLVQHVVGLGGIVVVEFGVNGLEYWMIGTNIALIISLFMFHRERRNYY